MDWTGFNVAPHAGAWIETPRDPLHGVNQARDKRLSDGDNVLNSALTQYLAQDMKIIELDGFTHVQTTLEGLAARQPDWFPHGFNGIHAVSNPELFAAFDPAGALFYMSAADDLVPGFAPAQALSDAITKLAQGDVLTFNQEYAVETLWHEIMHGRTGIQIKRLEVGVEPIEEGMVQILSRYSYPALLTAINKNAVANHQETIVANGLAYDKSASNLHHLLTRAGIERDTVLGLFFSEQDAAWPRLIEQVAERLAIKRERVITLLNHAKAKHASDFKEKVDVIIRNAQRKV